MRLANIPAQRAFLDTLAARWLREQGDDPGGGLILLPTRRAARAMAEAFLRVGQGRPMLLPRITAIGALDEAPLTLAGALDLPPAIGEEHRLAALAALILKLPEAQGGVRGADRAWPLAEELAALMDEAERAELDLPTALERATGGEHAEHWRITLEFLAIVTRHWPAFLAEHGLMNPAARQVAMLRAQARAWQDAPPVTPVWMAGATAGIPAVAELLRVVTRLPLGLVVLPGLDRSMEEAVWTGLEASHPQAGLARLLAAIGARRDDVTDLDGADVAPNDRVALFTTALRPAGSLSEWRDSPAARPGPGLSRLTSADQHEEAAAIAMVLRDAVETPGRRAALVTPDRALATRVTAELLRWGIVADDSAGEKLSHTPPAVFLRLLAHAVADRLGPVALLAVLKHPLVGVGLPTALCRDAARALERVALRGPRPMPGLDGIRRTLDRGETAVPPLVNTLLDRLDTALEPVLRATAAVSAAPADLLAALIASAERLAATDAHSGPARLWAQEEGEALATRLTDLLDVLPLLPDQAPAILPGLLDATLEGPVIRSRRALRGRDATAEHPRVFIWGLLESRLQSVDTIVLGGLTEGAWPAAADPGPWMSRPMRDQAGFADREEAIGQAAHDFVMAACAAPTAVLSAPRKRDGAPAVPARWLVRLEALLRGRNETLPEHPATSWVRALDQPAGPPRPVSPPRPVPPVALRPRKLSVTEIETWLADPYTIYARRILRLRPLDPLEQATDAADYGALVHRGMETFIRRFGTRWPPDAEHELTNALYAALGELNPRDALRAWWSPRLARIAGWIAETEILRRGTNPPVAIAAELRGEWALDTPHFVLTGRADRIERRADGTLAILDYKTGDVPTQANAEAGDAPQLLLEAAMASAGAFGPEWRGETAELAYWRLTGGRVPGSQKVLYGRRPAELPGGIANAEARLRELIRAFEDPARAYLAQPHPGRVPRFPQYAQLARVAEWSLAGEEEEA